MADVTHSDEDLRARKNSFLPVFSLPPEALEEIFTHCVRDYHEIDDHTHFRTPHWVNVSYVCRHWRDVALNCSPLWTYHFTASLRWTDELLARSKQATLKIRIYFNPERGDSWWLSLLEKLLNHAERIQELRLRVPASVLPSKKPSLCAPRLQILEIDGNSNPPFEWDILPLRALKLNGCSLPWHSLNMSELTTLSLSRVPPTYQQSIEEFLAMLPRMQCLTVLHLDRHALPSSRVFLSSGAFKVFPKIGLPCLTRLFVITPLSTVVALLSCINIPLKTEVVLEFELEDTFSVDDYAQIPSVLAQTFNKSNDLSSSSPTIRSLVVSAPSRYKAKFTLCGDHNTSFFGDQWDIDVPLVISVNTRSRIKHSDMLHMMSDICCSFPFSHVQTLHFSSPPYSPGFWRKILGHLHGLRHLKLSNGYMPDLACLRDIVADKPLETLRENSDHAFVPALEELKLYCIDFSAEGDLPGYAICHESLLDALSTRNIPPLLVDKIECSTFTLVPVVPPLRRVPIPDF